MASVEDKPNDELVEQAEEPTPAPEQVEQPDVEQVDQATFEDVEERGPERCKTRSRVLDAFHVVRLGLKAMPHPRLTERASSST